MSEEQAARADGSKANRVIFILASIYLIAVFLYRVLIPGNEWPMRTEQVMTMGFDLLVIVGLVGMKRRVPQAAILFWIALAAGVGLFAIRFSSEPSWWTGHLANT